MSRSPHSLAAASCLMPILVAAMFVPGVQRRAAGQTVCVPAVREGDGPRVLNEEGRPVGGATVSFLGTDGESGGRTVATATTRPGGTFRIPPRERDGAPRTQYSGWQVMVEAPGYGVGGGYDRGFAETRAARASASGRFQFAACRRAASSARSATRSKRPGPWS